MAERVKATDGLARLLCGADYRRYPDKPGSCPEGIDPDTWAESSRMADQAYVELIEGLDFSRILIEANKRHVALGHTSSGFLGAADIGFTTYEAICGTCILEVLLALDTNPEWTQQARSPRQLNPPPMPELIDPFALPG